jgi:hypothetical protein
MEQWEILSKIIRYQKAVTDNAFAIISIFQTGGEKMLRTTLDQQNWIPEKERKDFLSWSTNYQQITRQMKDFINKGYEEAERLVPLRKKSTQEPRETSVQPQDSSIRLKAALPKEIAVQSKKTADQSKDTAVQLKETVVPPKDTTIQSKETVVQPKDTAVQSKETADQPKDTAVQSKETADQPKDTVVQLKETVVQPKDTAVQLKDTLDQPKDIQIAKQTDTENAAVTQEKASPTKREVTKQKRLKKMIEKKRPLKTKDEETEKPK